MRIPWTPVKFSPLFREDKWLDFAQSMQLHLDFHTLPFVSQRRMPVLKTIEKRTKRMVSRTFNIKPKWQELIVAERHDKEAQVATLIQSLQDVIESGQTYLSDDAVVESVVDKQYALVQQLKTDYA